MTACIIPVLRSLLSVLSFVAARSETSADIITANQNDGGILLFAAPDRVDEKTGSWCGNCS